jgi:hypothetical protein
MSTKRRPKSVAELYEAHESIGAEAKALYDQKDALLKKLVRAWKKNRAAIALIEKNKTTGAETKYALEIEDAFRGQTKAFAPGFAHRYKLKLKTVNGSE